MGTVRKVRGQGLSAAKSPPNPGVRTAKATAALIANAEGRRRGRAPQHGESFDSARTRKESALADLRSMEVRVRAGELLEADVVRREAENDNRMKRSRVLACVSRIRTRFPHLSAEVIAGIDRELRDALEELANAGDLVVDEEGGDGDE